MTTKPCAVNQVSLAANIRAVKLENNLLSATVLVDKGADIYALEYKPHTIDVLWKSPWGLKAAGQAIQTSYASEVAWLEQYAGGWQLLFPNGGAACTYKGVELNFHGEASVVPWQFDIESSGDAAEIRLETRLFRSPFRIQRTLRVEQDMPQLIIHERITNEAGEPMDYMWGHHPAYGAPFLSEHCIIDTGATKVRVDAEYTGNNNPLPPNTRANWPHVAGVDLSKVPGRDAGSRDTLAYLTSFDGGWYGITNTQLGFGIGLSWDTAVFPHAWYWQEMLSSPGFPWYKNAYVLAIEPNSTIPGNGLIAAMRENSHLTLAAGVSHETELRAVFYESNAGILGIDRAGAVTHRG
jgi:Domain of unknown function (DUF4432)